MILLTHKNGQQTVQVKRDGEQLNLSGKPSKLVWQLARQFPEEILIWLEQDLEEFLEPEKVLQSVAHERIMVSYGVHSKFLPESIGYIDQLPFVNVNPAVKFPTWRMSSDVGGIRTKTLLAFEKDLKGIKDFDHLLNSIARIGQQNGLFCYSDPGLLQMAGEPVARAGDKELFSFVYSHYKSIWVFVLFFCLARYESRFPVRALFSSFFRRKFFGKQVDLPQISTPREEMDTSVDVIIPTLGRPQYLEQVVKDLSRQSLLPQRVIIVEQNPDPSSTTELTRMLARKWPFELVHIFTHELGACQARNRALNHTKAEWIFFSDDDQRLNKDFLKLALKQIQKLGVSCITTSYLQEGETKIFNKVKQWGTFGAGNSLVSKKFSSYIRFNESMEYGYGEDKDFGMQLRNSGCDVVYDPNLEIKHLKAPIGGFRKGFIRPWEKDNVIPKPSPTLMQYICKHYSREQIFGFRIKMLIEYYSQQEQKNPIAYLTIMNKRWQSSERWSKQLIRKDHAKV